jgi:NADH-quinone oxidoreductase subunit G
VRKAALRGAQVAMLNPARFPYLFPVKEYLSSAPADLVADLGAVVAAAAVAAGKAVPRHLAAAVGEARVTDAHRAIAQVLLSGERRAVWLGALAARHAAFADLRALAAALAQITGASLGRLTEGGNAAGAYLAGAIPHREAGAKPVAQPGLSARAMLENPLRAYLLFGGLEPSIDALAPESLRSLAKAEFVVAVTPFASEELKRLAHLLLPMGTFAETSGTYVNCEGLWQSQGGAAVPVGAARPGWKVLRVLGNLLGLDRFDYQSSDDVLREVREACERVTPAGYQGTHAVSVEADGAGAAHGTALLDVPMYQTDALLRRAPSLQKTREGRAPAVTY